MDMVVRAHIQNTGYERLELSRLCHVDLTLESHWVEAEPGLGHTQVLPLPHTAPVLPHHWPPWNTAWIAPMSPQFRLAFGGAS